MENKIRQIREEEGIKQNELAQMAGFSEGYICHLEKGTRKNPSSNAMIRIATALNRKVKEVFNVD